MEKLTHSSPAFFASLASIANLAFASPAFADAPVPLHLSRELPLMGVEKVVLDIRLSSPLQIKYASSPDGREGTCYETENNLIAFIDPVKSKEADAPASSDVNKENDTIEAYMDGDTLVIQWADYTGIETIGFNAIITSRSGEALSGKTLLAEKEIFRNLLLDVKSVCSGDEMNDRFRPVGADFKGQDSAANVSGEARWVVYRAVDVATSWKKAHPKIVGASVDGKEKPSQPEEQLHPRPPLGVDPR